MIRWRIHLASPPERVYALLATDAGRARFGRSLQGRWMATSTSSSRAGSVGVGAILAAEPP